MLSLIMLFSCLLSRSRYQAFYYVYQQQQSLDIANQAFQNMQKSYEVSKNKVDAGISAKGRDVPGRT